jgi:hypothetical protein
MGLNSQRNVKSSDSQLQSRDSFLDRTEKTLYVSKPGYIWYNIQGYIKTKKHYLVGRNDQTKNKVIFSV